MLRKGTPFMLDSLAKGPFALFFFGLFLIRLGVVGTCTGEASARFGRLVYRDKQPWQFWGEIAMDYHGGVFLIGYYFYKVYGQSN